METIVKLNVVVDLKEIFFLIACSGVRDLLHICVFQCICYGYGSSMFRNGPWH